MPPTVVTGQVHTKGTRGVNPDRLVVDMRKEIYTYDSGANPALRSITMRTDSTPVEAVEPKWLENEPVPEWDATTAAVGGTTGDTTIPVANGTYHKAGDVIRIPRTGEYVLVGSVSANNLVVTREIGGTVAAILSADAIHNMGHYDLEGNASPPAKATITVTKSNFTRILKTPVDLSRTASQVKVYGGNERARLRREAGQKHARLLELEFFHGFKREVISGADVRRFAGGLDFFVTTNILNANGMLSESEFYEWLGLPFRHGVGGAAATSKVLFAGQSLINTISMWGQAKLQTDSGRNKRYGFAIRTLLTPYGELDIVYHPLLEEQYAGYGYVVDMRGVKIGQLQPTVLETDIHDRDIDGYKDQYLSEQTYFVMNEEAHGVVRGVEF